MEFKPSQYAGDPQYEADRKVVREYLDKAAKEHEQWLEFWAKKLLPPVCIRWAKERKNLPALAAYVRRRNIRIVQSNQGTKETLMEGDKAIATFEAKPCFRT